MRAKLNQNGRVFYEGKSALDGSPIVGIATGLRNASNNSKTGALIPTYIMRADIPPHKAIYSGEDESICGDCRHRKIWNPDTEQFDRTCYVNVSKAPFMIFKCYARGGYPHATPSEMADIVAGRPVRLGAYGDPAAIPYEVWDPRILAYCMVSADSPAEASHARDIGARAYLVRPHGSTLPKGFSQCPAAEEAGKRTTCASCLLCGGNSVSGKSISILAHGQQGARFE